MGYRFLGEVDVQVQEQGSNLAISGSELQERRERVFLLLAGFFLCAMTLLNVIGITRFVQLGPMQIAVGVLAYPLTFLCTDLISELYGKKRANFLVSVGLILNVFILAIMALATISSSMVKSIRPATSLRILPIKFLASGCLK